MMATIWAALSTFFVSVFTNVITQLGKWLEQKAEQAIKDKIDDNNLNNIDDKNSQKYEDGISQGVSREDRIKNTTDLINGNDS